MLERLKRRLKLLEDRRDTISGNEYLIVYGQIKELKAIICWLESPLARCNNNRNRLYLRRDQVRLRKPS